MRHYIAVQELYLVFPMRTKSCKRITGKKIQKELIFTEYLVNTKQFETLYL